jgi:hypothetical protein
MGLFVLHCNSYAFSAKHWVEDVTAMQHLRAIIAGQRIGGIFFEKAVHQRD